MNEVVINLVVHKFMLLPLGILTAFIIVIFLLFHSYISMETTNPPETHGLFSKLCGLKWHIGDKDPNHCDFCNLEGIHQWGQVKVIENTNPSGQHHWLILPVTPKIFIPPPKKLPKDGEDPKDGDCPQEGDESQKGDDPKDGDSPQEGVESQNGDTTKDDSPQEGDKPKDGDNAQDNIKWEYGNHIRDIESLGAEHYDLLLSMDTAKKRLLAMHCPDALPHEIHSGYHRARRPLIGKILFHPDIISVPHMHMHVIVRPNPKRLRSKYPDTGPRGRIMWISDQKVLRKVEKLWRLENPHIP